MLLLLTPGTPAASLKAGGLTAPVRRALSKRATTMSEPRAADASTRNMAGPAPLERYTPAQPSSASHRDDADMSPQGVAFGGAGSTVAATAATGQAGDGGTSASPGRGWWPRILGERAAAAQSAIMAIAGRGRTSYSSAPASPPPVTSAATALPIDNTNTIAP
jgi:hypothetical protein